MVRKNVKCTEVGDEFICTITGDPIKYSVPKDGGLYDIELGIELLSKGRVLGSNIQSARWIVRHYSDGDLREVQ